ncbi:DNA-directed RNA polymerase, mitochondrial [Neonectria ditissima]|uniref:DNA-directed RNA polymerase n=1 Tax=Neonectria ditissima TaxID=78410 RepID=A0A0P7ARW0_9HYPO|nr:DNA-directed RNA polymerase, mitochondrial [Neonectria ditissima]
MLARQTRRSISLHQATALGPIGRQSRCLPLHLASSTLGRRCLLTQLQPRARRPSESTHGKFHGRRLATVADDFKMDSPYNVLAGSTMSHFDMPYFRQPWEAPVVIPEPTTSRTMNKMNLNGVPGDSEDMVQVFDACVRVGKLERAALVLKRFNTIGLFAVEERIPLHNQYLRASLNQLRTNPDRIRAEQLHKWYELEIRNEGIPQTAETIACMLKASLLSERGARLERLVKRYMSMAPGEAGLRVLSMADILSDSDLAVITEICPTYNFAPEEEDGEVTMASEEEQLDIMEGVDIAENPEVDSYPELLVTPQKGGGLTTLKHGLNLMTQLENVDISKLSVEEQREFQIRLERDSVEAAITKWRDQRKHLQKMGVNTALNANTEDGSLSHYLPSWLKGVEARLKVEIAKIEESESKVSKSEEDFERCMYGPFLRQADPTRLAAVTILSVLNHGAMMGIDKGVVVGRLINDVARVAQEDIRLQEEDKRAKERRRRRKVQFTGSKDGVQLSNDEIIMDATGPEAEEKHQGWEKPWSINIKAQVGSILLKSLIDTAKVKVVRTHPVTGDLISQYQPAFSHMMSPRKGKKLGVLVLNADLVERMKREPVGDFLAKHLPMVAEPKPWKRMYEGGFLESKAPLVRVKPGDDEQKLYTKAAIQRGDMNQIFKGLDVLGKTPWRINRDVLGVMMEAWNTGETVANMPPLHPNLEVPPEPDSSEDPLIRRRWIREVKSVENERAALHSQRCYMNLQLEIARAFRNQTIYFPHNVDYRGRAYPIPTYLNHMGADHTRAILKFAKGKELGTNGLKWLKIHLANVYGFDKASFDEREAFATDNLTNIVDSATNPLNGAKWWLKAEDPWQCLAACFELAAAHKLDDPTKFVSQLPVHQDGTCNGLQHYAALGGDTWGAQQVNLMPGDRPADVYSAVANLVRESIAKDAAANNRIAHIVADKITRKVVKQTVMTNVYGVTFSGAKAQVCKQIDSLYPDLAKESGVPHLLLATYIAKHIFTALGTMFRGAHDIQYWLGEIGGRVCRALTPSQLQQIANTYEGENASANSPAVSPTETEMAEVELTKTGKPKKSKTAKAPKVSKTPKMNLSLEDLTQQFRSTVVWTTPLRMPVAQPYRKPNFKEVRTCLQSVAYTVTDTTDPVNRRKQLQGFPPNFIHSLDASHMLLSALQCNELGLDFAAVHDSFWTHAADVDVMNGVIRDSFIRIHEEDVVGRLAKEFEARYKGSLYLTHIASDTPVAVKIKELRKSSKLSSTEEVMLEYKRNTLRQSGNPWDLEAAKKIVTPASIYEEMAANEEDVEIHEEAEEMALGSIPESEAILDEAALRKKVKQMQEEDALATQKSTDFTQGLLNHMKHSLFENVVTVPKKPRVQVKKPTTIAVWLPLTFPDLPKKGDFDVSQLRDSKYFFS